MSKSWLEMLKNSSEAEKKSTNQSDEAGWLKMLKKISEQQTIEDMPASSFDEKLKRYAAKMRNSLTDENFMLFVTLIGFLFIVGDFLYFDEWFGTSSFIFEPLFDALSKFTEDDFLWGVLYLPIALVLLVLGAIVGCSYIYAAIATIIVCWYGVTEVWNKLFSNN